MIGGTFQLAQTSFSASCQFSRSTLSCSARLERSSWWISVTGFSNALSCDGRNSWPPGADLVKSTLSRTRRSNCNTGEDAGEENSAKLLTSCDGRVYANRGPMFDFAVRSGAPTAARHRRSEGKRASPCGLAHHRGARGVAARGHPYGSRHPRPRPYRKAGPRATRAAHPGTIPSSRRARTGAPSSLQPPREHAGARHRRPACPTGPQRARRAGGRARHRKPRLTRRGVGSACGDTPAGRREIGQGDGSRD